MSRPIYVGIDPGLTGAVAAIAPDDRVLVWDMPTITTQVEKKKTKTRKGGIVNRNVPDEAAMVKILSNVLAATQYSSSSVYVVLEKVNAMPAMGSGGRNVRIGATSMFNFGFGYGLWCMALVALQLAHDRVHPATWKAAVLAGVGREDEEVTAEAARLYPRAGKLLRGPRGGLMMGRVDALLIAHYGKDRVEPPTG